MGTGGRTGGLVGGFTTGGGRGLGLGLGRGLRPGLGRLPGRGLGVKGLGRLGFGGGLVTKKNICFLHNTFIM